MLQIQSSSPVSCDRRGFYLRERLAWIGVCSLRTLFNLLVTPHIQIHGFLITGYWPTTPKHLLAVQRSPRET